MRDRPQGAELLAQARRLLREDILPELTSRARFKVLMALRAMDLAERELRADPVQENKLEQRLAIFPVSGNTAHDRFKALSINIRDGNFDASDEVYEFLQQITAFKLK